MERRAGLLLRSEQEEEAQAPRHWQKLPTVRRRDYVQSHGGREEEQGRLSSSRYRYRPRRRTVVQRRYSVTLYAGPGLAVTWHRRHSEIFINFGPDSELLEERRESGSQRQHTRLLTVTDRRTPGTGVTALIPSLARTRRGQPLRSGPERGRGKQPLLPAFIVELPASEAPRSLVTAAVQA
eukprot:765989-Hanusia_phi.AAC.1